MTTLHSFCALVCGLLVTPLILYPAAWGDLILLAVIVALLYIFWNPLVRLTEGAWQECEMLWLE